MYSTPEERHQYNHSRGARSRHTDTSGRPTIEQIAMGLHVSRTPHLRPIGNPLQRHSAPTSPSRRNLNAANHAPHVPPHLHPHATHDSSSSSILQHRTRHSLPPPPSRSSMKKASASSSTLSPPQQPFVLFGASPSTSTVTSGGPATPDSSRSVSSLKLRMSKLIPGFRPSQPQSPTGRVNSFASSSESDGTRPATPRKAVRFSTSVLALGEQPS
ncbi:hypothetical protein HYDPIDRAFT_130934 [Hydnomerulius pinastri MD-312]|nr:hypothetical protein HYDPIDRAFT_130934 [Hydnomerulius pinastri MD-312]